MFKSHHFYRLTLIRGVYVLCTYKTLLKIYFRNGFIKSEANFYLLRLNSSTLSLNLYTEHRFCVSFVRPSKAEIEATQQSFSFCWNWWRQFFSFAKCINNNKKCKKLQKKTSLSLLFRWLPHDKSFKETKTKISNNPTTHKKLFLWEILRALWFGYVM